MWLLLALPALAASLSMQARTVLAAGTQALPPWLAMLSVLGAAAYPILAIAAIVASLLLDVGMARQSVRRPVRGVHEALGRVSTRLAPLLGVGMLALVGIVAWSILSWSVSAAASSAALPGPFFAAMTAVTWITLALVELRLGFTVCGILLAQDGVGQAIGHSLRLTRGRVTRWAGYLAAIWGPGLVTSLVLAAWPLATGGRRPPGLYLTADLLAFLWLPVQSGVRVLAWYRFRAEAEGLTIADAIAELTGPSRPRADRPARHRVGPPPGEAWEPPATALRRRRRPHERR